MAVKRSRIRLCNRMNDRAYGNSKMWLAGQTKIGQGMRTSGHEMLMILGILYHGYRESHYALQACSRTELSFKKARRAVKDMLK